MFLILQVVTVFLVAVAMSLALAPAEAKRLAERVLAETAAGRIRPIIGQTFPLEQAAAAHAAIEARVVIGKTLLLI